MFSFVQRPDAGLLFRRNDPHDPRLGEAVAVEPHDLAACEVVLLGCPQDEGVARNGGRIGARLAPDAIRRCFYRLTTNGMERLRLFDLGNLVLQPTLEETHEALGAVTEEVLKAGKTLIVLGGGNDISYPDVRALSKAFEGDVLALNIDAHLDVRADSPRNSGTPYRQLLEEGWIAPARFFELGSEPLCNSAPYLAYLQERGATVIPRTQWQALALEKILQVPAQAIFVGLDMDVVNASEAPGVSAPNPLGLRGTELVEAISTLGRDPRVKLLEITEVNPEFDSDQRTARLAAATLWHFLHARKSAAE